jgi:hypothetical protein
MKSITQTVAAIGRALAAIGIALLFATVATAQSFDHVQYLKGSNGNGKGGEKVSGSLQFNNPKQAVEFVNKKGTSELSIPNASIKNIIYERTAHPRYVQGLLIAWPLLLTKTKKHYLTVQYADAAGNGQFVILHMDKNNYRGILAAAEAQTGKKVQRAEED